MARDNQGNDLGAIDVQLTGFAAINFNATQAPTLVELAGNTIPTGYEYLGLFLEDGGYAEESEAGDLTYFFQQGYTIRTGDQSISGKLTPAEDNDTVWKLTGITNNVREKICYEGSFGLIIATQFKNGNIVARGGMAHVTEVAPSAESRGEINSIEISFEWEYSTEYDGYYRIIRAGQTLEELNTEITTENWDTVNSAEITNSVIVLPNIDTRNGSSAILRTGETVTTTDTFIYSFSARKTDATITNGNLRLRSYSGQNHQQFILIPESEVTDAWTTYSGSAPLSYDTTTFNVQIMNSVTSVVGGAYEVKDVQFYIQRGESQ